MALQLRNAAWHAINALPAAAAANGQAGGNTHPASNAVADAVQYASAVTQSSMQFLHLAWVFGPGKYAGTIASLFGETLSCDAEKR
jgi:hypothetical protein